MKKTYTKNNKFTAFLKKNIYYLVMVVCVLAIGTMVTVALVNADKDPVDVGGGNIVPDPNPNPNPDPEPEPEPEPEVPMVFNYPLTNGNVIRIFAQDSHVFNPTLNQYAVHLGIDFSGEANSAVFAAYDGVVESVTEDPLNGKMVVIKHKDNVRTIYSSLGEIQVTKDQQVVKGQGIGTIGTSMSIEVLDGAHVHFAVTNKGAFVDPNQYFPEGDK